MRVLAIDTASPAPALALLLADGPDAGSRLEVEELGAAAAETIPAHLALLLSRAGIPLRSLDTIAVLSGPGSFTGLRAGTAFSRGLARALEIPLVAASTFRVAARALSAGDSDILLGAGRGEVHRARLRGDTLDEETAPVPLAQALGASESEGVATLSLDQLRQILAPTLARIATEGSASGALAILYGRPSAAEERWG